MLRVARICPCYGSVSPNPKFKLPIRTVHHDIHIEICLETKFYIFLNFFTIFYIGMKFVNLKLLKSFKTYKFITLLKIVKNFQKI